MSGIANRRRHRRFVCSSSIDVTVLFFFQSDDILGRKEIVVSYCVSYKYTMAVGLLEGTWSPDAQFEVRIYIARQQELHP